MSGSGRGSSSSGSSATSATSSTGTSSTGSMVSTQLSSTSTVYSEKPRTQQTQQAQQHPTSGTGCESDRSVSLVRRHYRLSGVGEPAAPAPTAVARTPPNAAHHMHRGPARSVSLADKRSGPMAVPVPPPIADAPPPAPAAAASAAPPSHKRVSYGEGAKPDGHKAVTEAAAPAVPKSSGGGSAPATTAREPTKIGGKAKRLGRKQMVTAREVKPAKQQAAGQSADASAQGQGQGRSTGSGSHYAYEYSSGTDFHKKLESWSKSDKQKSAMFDQSGSPTSKQQVPKAAEGEGGTGGTGGTEGGSGDDSNGEGDGDGDEPDPNVI